MIVKVDEVTTPQFNLTTKHNINCNCSKIIRMSSVEKILVQLSREAHTKYHGIIHSPEKKKQYVRAELRSLTCEIVSSLLT